MATRNTKKIGANNVGANNDKRTYLHKDNWEVMKPFVHFSIKAMAVIGAALIAIIKVIPKALEHKQQGKSDRIIKI